MDEMRKRLRYHIDFEAIPTICQNGKGAFVGSLLQGGEGMLASVYNQIWQQYYPERPFAQEDFDCQHIYDNSDHMIFVALPANDIDSRMICTHMAITYKQAGNQITNVQVYHVEYGNTGTTAIGSMKTDQDGPVVHTNYGSVCESDADNIFKIWQIAFPQTIIRPRNRSYA